MSYKIKNAIIKWDRNAGKFDLVDPEGYFRGKEILVAIDGDDLITIQLLVNAIVKNDFNTEYKNGFIIMTSCCLLIETIASYFEGINQTKKSGSEVFNFIFNKANEYNNDLKDFVNEPFYKNVRCALLHQGETYNKFKIRRDGILYDRENKIINAKLFCDSLNQFLISYKKELCAEKWDGALWDNCRLKLRFIIQNSR